MLMEDELFGHRDPFTGAPLGDKDEWLAWDFALAKVIQTIEAYTDKNGIPAWKKDDPQLEIYADKKFDEFQADIDNITGSKHYTKKPGEYFVPGFKSLRKDKSEWTYMDWRNDQIEKARKKAEE